MTHGFDAIFWDKRRLDNKKKRIFTLCLIVLYTKGVAFKLEYYINF